MSRSTRKTIAVLDKERLVACFNNGGEWRSLAAELSINYNSAKTIISQYRQNGVITQGRRGTHKECVLTGEIGQHLTNYVEENNLATLTQMKQFLSNDHNVNVSIPTITRFLDKKCLSIKLVRTIPANRNSNEVLDRRQQYVKWLVDNGIGFSQCLYIDECGFNIWIKRSYGRSHAGERCFRTAHGQRGRNISMCVCISVNGIVHYSIRQGAFDRDAFVAFLSEVSALVGENNVKLIMDNCRIHHNVANPREGHEIVHLPAYSPFLNPIESFFNKIKSAVKREMASANLDVDQAQRQQLLFTAMENAIESNRILDLEPFYRHCAGFHSKCIEREVILGD